MTILKWLLIGAAVLWWTVRSLMGWHSGRATYWLSTPREDDLDDNDDDGGGDNTGMNAP